MRNGLVTFSSLIAAVLATSAMAADLPSRARAPAPAFVAPLPTFSWTGFYVGANIGGSFGGDTSRFRLNNGSVQNSGGTDGVLSPNTNQRTGFTGGGQLGYNYQFSPGNSFVVGLEADLQYVDRGSLNGSTTNYTFTPTNGSFANNGVAFVPVPGLARPTVIITGQKRTDWFGTVRGRLGYAFDRFLAYGTGGFAYNGNSGGYAVGGGLEYALTNSLSVRAEYLHVNLGNRGGTNSTAIFNLAANTVTLNGQRSGEKFNVVRAGLNYKF